MSTPYRPLILCVSKDPSLRKLQTEILIRAGYSGISAAGIADVEEILPANSVALMVLDFTLNRSERIALARRVKEADPTALVLVLHSSGHDNPFVDAAVDSRTSPNALLEAVSYLFLRKRVRSHQHPELNGKYLIYADKSRQLVEMTDHVCQLLGYQRTRLIGRTIEDISHVHYQQVEQMFHTFLEDGSLAGDYVLRHRSGKPIKVKYEARVFEDGCMISSLEPQDQEA